MTSWRPPQSDVVEVEEDYLPVCSRDEQTMLATGGVTPELQCLMAGHREVLES